MRACVRAWLLSAPSFSYFHTSRQANRLEPMSLKHATNRKDTVVAATLLAREHAWLQP